MCGIAGFLGSFDPALLHTYNRAMAHRGPDGEGTWHHDPAGIGLAHRRLSIIDLSSAAAQPMHGCGSRYIVSFNGEIYNYKELYEKLKDKYEIKPGSDTAVLAPLYDAYGPKMLDHINGIFTFAIWDQKTGQLFLARDHVGVKPLYYTQNAQGFAFASELKTLLHTPGINKTLNPTAVADYLTYLWTPGPHTMLAHVHKLRPGHFILLRRGEEVMPQKYYTPPTSNVYDTSKDSRALYDFFNVIVKDQSLADVPVGAFLSGGVDSSAIVASMVAQNIPPKQAYCVSFHDSSMAAEGFSDDVIYARQVAQHLGIKLTEVPASAKNLERLPALVRTLEEPLADPAPLYVQDISAAARADGLKVLLSGTGGDDVFAGYRRHQAAMLRSRLRGLSQPIGHTLTYLSGIMPPGTKKRRLQKFGYMLAGSENEFLHRAFEFSPFAQTHRLLQDDFVRSAPQKDENALKCALKTSEGLHPLNRLLFMEFHGFMPDLNLTYTDKAGMAESVEIRVPFLDKRLINWAKDIPIAQKIKGTHTKHILKKAFENQVPRGIFDRPKAGFGAPIRQWISQDRAGFIRDTLQLSEKRGIFNNTDVKKIYNQTLNGQLDGAYTILSLAMIELWCQQFIDA
jgi:asparagine synthase (glutamine-hydrolysing)